MSDRTSGSANPTSIAQGHCGHTAAASFRPARGLTLPSALAATLLLGACASDIGMPTLASARRARRRRPNR